MLRSPSSRKGLYPAFVERRAPQLRVIEGGLASRKEPEAFDIGSLVYCLVVLARLEERRRPDVPPPNPFVDEETTDVQLRAPRETEETPFVDTNALTRQALRRIGAPGTERGPYASLKVLHQFVRRVLGRTGLEAFLTEASEDVIGRLRAQRRRPKTFHQVYALELAGLVARVRTFVAHAGDTGQKTRRGYAILRATVDGRSYFITFNAKDAVIVGIYTEAQFTRKRAFRRSRECSHRLARGYRKNPVFRS